MSEPLKTTFKAAAMLVLVVAGALLAGPAGVGPEPQSAEAAFLSELKKLLASDTQNSDFFGLSVAVSGDTAVVGSRSQAGAAYVFQRDQGSQDNWGEVAKLTASDAEANDNFGSSVAVSGNTAVVGANAEDSGGLRAGAAYVFQRDQGGADNWGEVKKLTASDAQASDFFGISVAVSGDTAVVGAASQLTTDAGAAYVFQRDEGSQDNWGEMKKLSASDAQPGDRFGDSVAIGGDVLVVGAPGEDDGGNAAGAAYVFQRDQGGGDHWGEVTKLNASDAQAGDGLGSVAVSGDTAVVGAFMEDSGGFSAGAAYVFQRNDGGTDNWGEIKKLTASDAQADDNFGIRVAVSGDTAVVGAFMEDSGGFSAGAAYVFQRNDGGTDNWGEVTKITASDAGELDFFGFSVAVDGDTAVVGAPDEDTGGTFVGAAYVFDLLSSKPTPTPTPTPTITPTPFYNPVGGIALDEDASLRPLNEPDSESGGFGAFAWAVAAAAGAAALGGGAWYARKRAAG